MEHAVDISRGECHFGAKRILLIVDNTNRDGSIVRVGHYNASAADDRVFNREPVTRPFPVIAKVRKVHHGKRLDATTGNGGLHGKVVKPVFDCRSIIAEIKDARAVPIVDVCSICRGNDDAILVDSHHGPTAEIVVLPTNREIHQITDREHRLGAERKFERTRRLVCGHGNDFIRIVCAVGAARVLVDHREQNRIRRSFLAGGVVITARIAVGKLVPGIYEEIHVLSGFNCFADVIHLTGNTESRGPVSLETGSREMLHLQRCLRNVRIHSGITVIRNDERIRLKVPLVRIRLINLFAVWTNELDSTPIVDYCAGRIQALVVLGVIIAIPENGVQLPGIGDIQNLVEFSLGGKTDNTTDNSWGNHRAVTGIVFDPNQNSGCPNTHLCSHDFLTDCLNSYLV